MCYNSLSASGQYIHCPYDNRLHPLIHSITKPPQLAMKKLKLSIEEFFTFKSIATFIYQYSYSKGKILVEADAKQLEALGY